MPTETRNVLVIDYADLVSGAKEATEIVEKAYGYDGMGLLAVINLPEEFIEIRDATHAVIREFASLTDREKETFEVPPFFQRGWDHGNEKMKDGTPDKLKGSFYFNPVKDAFTNVDKPLVDKYPTFYGNNLFPSKLVPGFEAAVKRCSEFQISVSTLIARECDKIIAAAQGVKAEDVKPILENIVRSSHHHASRCLYYFPIAAEEVDTLPEDGWCGWHNDHSMLTCLIPAEFYDVEKKEVVPNPDPRSGLYIKARNGTVIKPKAPGPNCLLFQIGETAQLLSKGKLLATPHMVRPPKAAGFARTTMPIFLQPAHDFVIPSPGEAALEVAHLPDGVPELKTRYKTDNSFGDFSMRTFKAYYDLKQASS